MKRARSLPVPNFLRREGGLRAMVAIAAAYGLALQMLLSALAATQMAAADPLGAAGPICHASASAPASGRDGGSPASHTACSACTLAGAAPPLPDAAEPIPVQPAAATRYLLAHTSRLAAKRRHEPQSPQGPPQIA
jgi:hypothetical protein